MPTSKIERVLKKLLKLRPGTTDILHNRESSKIEFKETFNLGSRAKYARSMAAFANNQGGYILFGVEPSPHRLKGLNEERFNRTDPARLTGYLNSHFSPELVWEMGIIDFEGRRVGYIYTYEAGEKPIIAIRDDSNVIHESDIYYRYKAQSAIIKYSELRRIIEERLSTERRAWMQHLQTIGNAGPTNVGILDTIHGKLYGAGPPFLIDETLLRKLKFIRHGRFSETEGEPTLKVVGEVKPVSGITKEKPVAVGIHAEDLITAFLAQRQLDEAEARSYFRETAYQTSPYVPLHYYKRLAALSLEEAREIIKEVPSPFRATKRRILERLSLEETVEPVGAINRNVKPPKPFTQRKIRKALKGQVTHKDMRSLLRAILAKDASIIGTVLDEIPDIIRACEAVTHLKRNSIHRFKIDILEFLLSIFRDYFITMTGAERTVYRKAVAFCDEVLAMENNGA